MKSTPINVTEKICDDLYVITETKSVHCYVMLGKEKALVFDIGYGYEDIMPLIREITDLPVMLVISHGDPDHGLGCSHFEDVWLHELDYGKLIWNDTVEMRQQALNYRLKKMPELNGVIQVEDYVSQRVYGHTRPHFLKEHDIIDLGGTKLEVLHTPGHSYGHIMLLDKEHRRLFTGDQVTQHNVWYFLSNDQNAPFELARRSLRKLLARSEEFDELYPAHDIFPIKVNHIEDLLECLEIELIKTYAKDEIFHSFLGIDGYQHYYKDTVNLIYSKERLEEDLQMQHKTWERT